MESKELFVELAKLRDEVDEQGLMLDALVRANGVGRELIEILRADEKAEAVLLAVDGKRSQQEIVGHLKSSGVSISPATVSRKIDYLANDLGLIALSHHQASGKVYHRTRLDRALKVSRELEKSNS